MAPSDPEKTSQRGVSRDLQIDKSAASDSHNNNSMVPREALERVLARAVELQTIHQHMPEGISESRMIEIAREVGIDTANLRQAMAEERARLPLEENDDGFLLDALGPAFTAAQRTVPGSPAEIIAKLEAWMPRMEMLEKRRRVGERLSWEPKRDTLSNMFRGLSMAGRQPDLVRANQVSAVVMPIDDKRSVVRFQSDMYGVRRTQRTVYVTLATALSLAFLVVAIPLLVLIPSTSLSIVGVTAVGAVVAGTGYGVWQAMKRSYRKLVDRAHLRLEQLLDELESGGMQTAPGLLHQVRDALLGKPGY